MEEHFNKANKADRILELLEDRSQLLNAVILRCFERGHIQSNLAFMSDELEMKIALPWIKDECGDQPYWFRHRYGVPLTAINRDDLAAEVITVEGDLDPIAYEWLTALESEDADTVEEAQQAADAALRTTG